MDRIDPDFDYAEFTTRNYGFVNASEQQQLRDASVFVCGVGGMGGAAIQSLARIGIGHFVIADMDVFEVSNLNRQVFATLDSVGTEKTDATAQAIARINPKAKVEIFDGNWPSQTDTILAKVDIVLNGMDDVAETVKLYRACRASGHTIIDAYAASLPSVYVTRAGDATPEERLQYPTRGKPPETWTEDDLSQAFLRELEYVMGCSSSRKYIDMQAGAEMAAGERSRMSLAPMVILTGNLMAYEIVNAILGRKSGASNKGYFFNPFTGRTERPLFAPVEWLQRTIARRVIAGLMKSA